MALTKIDDRGLKTPIDLLDNEKIRLGTGNDLELYHDGSNSYIKDTGTGNLQIVSNQTNIQDADLSHYQAKFIDGGAVELYHSGTKKFETTTDGVQVTGEVVSGTLHCSGKLDLPDSTGATVGRVLLGTGDDLSLYHDGTDNYISASNGHLSIYGDGTNEIYIRGLYNEDSIIIVPNGTVKLFHNNSQKLETTSWGTQIYGALATTGNIDCATDSYKIKAGASGDLEIYHDGSHTRVDNQTGALFIRNNTGTYNGEPIKIQPLSGEESLICNPNAAVKLYYDNNLKFETTSGGAEVFGELQMDDANSHIKLPDNARIDIGNGSDLKIYHDGTTNIIEGLNGNMSLRPKTGENGILIRNDGSVDLYYNDAKKFETQSGGTLTTGHITSKDADGVAGKGTCNFGTSGGPQIRGFDTGNHGSGSKLELISGDGDDHIICKRNGAVEIFHDGIQAVYTKNLSGGTETGKVGLRFAQNKAIQFHDNQLGIATAAFSMNANTWTTVFSHDSYVAATIHMSSVHNAGFSSATWIMSKSASGGSSVVRTGHNNAYSPANLDVRIDGNNFQIKSSYGTYGYMIINTQYNMGELRNFVG